MPTSRPPSYGGSSRRPELFRISCELSPDSSVLPPLLVLPEQIFSLQRAATGTRALMLAVLESAVQDFQQRGSQTARSQRYAREAERWLWSEDTTWPFSFLNICQALAFDPSYMRGQLLRWRDQFLSSQAAEQSAA